MLRNPETIEELLIAKEGENHQFKEAKLCFDSGEVTSSPVSAEKL